MNNDLISRSALKKAIDAIKQTGYDTDCVTPLFDYIELPDLINVIDNAPTVDAYTEDDVKTAIKEGHKVGYEMAKAKFERPQGEWIEYFDSSSGFTWRTCSRCMFEDGKKYYKFCPNCGAYMRGGRE